MCRVVGSWVRKVLQSRPPSENISHQLVDTAHPLSMHRRPHTRSSMPLSDEQLAILDHDVSDHGRVLAGPGTGKSFTNVALVLHLQESRPDLNVRMFTFTRAATQELARKLEGQGVTAKPPSTIHAFALGLLVRNPDSARIPLPLRIPDAFEVGLIRADIARRLRNRGFAITTTDIRKHFEPEMSARWESLDPDYVMAGDLDPELRRAYQGLWERHRRAFGYTLLAELPFRAGNALEDFEPDIGGIDLLIVDEFQDLNHADIHMLQLLDQRGVRILAIGDDDQSIYSFRMAAPHGIRDFLDDFGTTNDYTLTTSYRCGPAILDAANDVIECSPDRLRRPRLTPFDPEKPSRLVYTRFRGHRAEAEGVARMIDARKRAGVSPGDIAILVRSGVANWARVLRPELEARNIQLVDTDWVSEALNEPRLRTVLAELRIVTHEEDSLAWWSLLDLTRGIAAVDFVDYVYQQAVERRETFGHTLLALAPNFPEAPSERSARRTAELIGRERERASTLREELDGEVELGEHGWGGWILGHVNREDLPERTVELLETVGANLTEAENLGQFLGQLEPVGKDLATVADSVRLMTMTGSKGLTVNTVFVMGVEDGLVPDERGDLEEERRLLYVAMTRAEELCVLTFARQRRGPIARQGRPRVGRRRGRCLLLEGLDIGNFGEGNEVVREIETEVDRSVSSRHFQ